MEPPEDAVRVLRHVRRLCRDHGILLDLTSIPPAAVVECGGMTLGSLDQTVFLERAAVTERIVDRLVAGGALVEEARVEVDVLKHFDSGVDLVADVDERVASRVPGALRSVLRDTHEPVVERSFSLLRRLRLAAR